MRAVLGLSVLLVIATSGGASASAPSEGLDGHVAFVVAQRGIQSIAVRALTGGPTRLVAVPRLRGKRVRVESIAWSRTGERFAFSDTGGRVFVASASRGAARDVTPDSLLRRGDGIVQGWAPDGRRLAVTSNLGCEGEPRLYLVSTSQRAGRELPTRPARLRAPSAARPAVIEGVAWSRSGNRLSYTWLQFNDTDCRTMGSSHQPARVMTLAIDRGGQRLLMSRYHASETRWSQSDESLAVGVGCGDDELLAWGPDDRDLFFTTIYDSCSLIVVRASGGLVHDATFVRSRVGGEGAAAVYALDSSTRAMRLVRSFGRGSEFAYLGVLPGRGVVGRVFNSGSTRARLVVLRFDGSAPVTLPPLVAPRGMRLGLVVAAGVR